MGTRWIRAGYESRRDRNAQLEKYAAALKNGRVIREDMHGTFLAWPMGIAQSAESDSVPDIDVVTSLPQPCKLYYSTFYTLVVCIIPPWLPKPLSLKYRR